MYRKLGNKVKYKKQEQQRWTMRWSEKPEILDRYQFLAQKSKRGF